MSAAQYIAAHRYECRHYGVTPLPVSRLRTMRRAGRSLHDAYSVACDRGAGFTYAESFAALDRQGA